MSDSQSVEALEALAQVAWREGVKSAAPFAGHGLHIEATDCSDHIHYFLYECREHFTDPATLENVDRLFAVKHELAKQLVPVHDGSDGPVIGFMPGVVYS